MAAKQQSAVTPVNWQEVIWICAIVVPVMLSQLWLQLGVSPHLALFSALAATTVSDHSIAGLLKAFVPTILTAALALLVSQLFAAHPWVIWTISLWLFDFTRQRCDTPAKQSRMLMPTLNWFLVVVFFQHSDMSMSGWLRDMSTALMVTIVVVQIVRCFVAAPQRPTPAAMAPVEVSYRQRLVFLLLLGIGLAFLMMVDIVAATFCMMPVIAAAGQSQLTAYQGVLRGALFGQVGGCALAMVFVSLLMGQHQHLLFYALALLALVAMIAYWIGASTGPVKMQHTQALLGTMLPLQLYLSSTDLGLQDTFQRGGMLVVVVLLLVVLQGVIYGTQSSGDHHRGRQLGH